MLVWVFVWKWTCDACQTSFVRFTPPTDPHTPRNPPSYQYPQLHPGKPSQLPGIPALGACGGFLCLPGHLGAPGDGARFCGQIIEGCLFCLHSMGKSPGSNFSGNSGIRDHEDGPAFHICNWLFVFNNPEYSARDKPVTRESCRYDTSLIGEKQRFSYFHTFGFLSKIFPLVLNRIDQLVHNLISLHYS